MTETITQISVSLRPCLFCGCEDMRMIIIEEETEPELEPLYNVRCLQCDASGPTRDNPSDAIQWWNGDMLQIAIDERQEDKSK